MSQHALTAAVLMTKADRAAASARVLLQEGDLEGAANRAYYAMFDAARAALLASGAPVEPEIARTHSGDFVEPADATVLVEQAETFVASMRLSFSL